MVSDLRLPDGDGIDLLRWMRKEGMMQPFIIMTDYAEVNTVVESMKLGSRWTTYPNSWLRTNLSSCYALY